MRIKSIFFVASTVAIVILFYLFIRSLNLTFPGIYNKPMRMLLFSLTIAPDSEKPIQETVDAINRILDNNPDIQRPIVLVELDSTNHSIQQSIDHESIARFLGLIRSDPIFVFGENISNNPDLNTLIEPRYDRVLINSDKRRTIQVIKADSSGLVSYAIQRITGRIMGNPDPGLVLYNPYEEPQMQYDWLSSLVGNAHTANILITQKNLNRVEDAFQKKLLDVVCSSQISIVVSMSQREDLFHTGVCPGYSFSMIGAPKHQIGFLGIQTGSLPQYKLHYKEIVFGRQSVEIIDHKL